VNDIAEYYNNIIYNLHKKIDQLEEKVEKLKTAEEKKRPTMNHLSEFFIENVENLTKFLNKQNENPITDPDQFEKCLKENNHSLFHFYKMIFKSANPDGKNLEKQKNLRVKVMVLCHSLANFRNNKVTNITNSIGSFLYKNGLSISAINFLSNIWCIPTYSTILDNSKKIVSLHKNNVSDFIKKNIENTIILNIDDFHDCHQSNIPNITSSSQICHMATTLINISKIPAVPSYSPDNNKIHQNGLIDANKLKSEFKIIMKKYKFTDNILKNNNESLSPSSQSTSTHSHDENSTKRSFNNTKLFDFVQSNLKSTDDYLNILKNFVNTPEIKEYLQKNIIVVPCDFPGQKYIRKLIVKKIFNENNNIPNEISNMVPFLGPLHVSLNTREACFLKFHAFFNKLHIEVFNKSANYKLADKPKPFRISQLLGLAHSGWLLIRDTVLKNVPNLKIPGVQIMIDLLDNIIPSTLDVYDDLFKGNKFDDYFDTIFRLWMIMTRFNRKNHNKIMLIFLSDVLYWKKVNHPIIEKLYHNLNLFDDYPVENFHSLIRRNISSKVTAPETLRRYGINIDYEKHSNQFVRTLIPGRTYSSTKPILEHLSKKSAIFLLGFFKSIVDEQDNFRMIKNPRSYNKSTVLMPPLQKELPICVLPCGFHTTIKPCSTKLCDMEGCELVDNNTNILTCGHAYHVPCLKKLDDICIYCLDYYTKEIDKLSLSFNNQLLNDIETEDIDDLGIDENDGEEGEDGDEESINISSKENVNVENELTQAIDSFIRSFNVDLLSNNVVTSSIQKDNSAKNKRRRVGVSKGNKKKKNIQ